MTHPIIRPGKRGLRIAALAFALGLALANGTATAQSGLLERGHALAQQHCNACHAIGRDDDSPDDDVIPFRDMQQFFPIDMLVEARRTGVISGHDEMPMFELGRADVAALLAYIDSLNPSVPGYGSLPPD